MHTLTGHSDQVSRVAFSGDGAQVVSASNDDKVRFVDIASGRQVRQLVGNMFDVVAGLSAEHKGDHHVITISGDTLWIYEIGNEEQHTEDGVAPAAAVACFKAPKFITSVQCHGAAICMGCRRSVYILLAPFLAA